jgi:serine/threonine protein kinase/outer membrane protein assembly factor BamD (BamD/ComL family)
MIARFQHEARTASSLNHPNICTIYEIAEHEGRHFIVMELLEGEVLSRVIGGRPMATERVIDLGIQIAEALEAAHAGGIVHRDIKPANIFVSDSDHVKLLDFGLAVPLPSGSHGMTPEGRTGNTSGTAPYMSPEQVRGENLDARSDLFSTGVVLYEMITGRRAFNSADVRTIMDLIGNHTPMPMRELDPTVHPELERIVGKAIEKNRKLRFQTAGDLRGDLQRLKRDLDSIEAATIRSHGALEPSRGVSSAPSQRGKRMAYAGAILLGIVLTAIVIGRVHNARRPLPSASAPGAPSAASARGDVVLPAAVIAEPVAHENSPPVRAPAPVPVPAPAAPRPVITIDPVDPAPVSSTVWAEQELRVARAKVDARLFDQALLTLQGIVAKEAVGDVATEAYFLMASVQERQGRVEDAMATYLDFAHRYGGDARAPEALFLMAQTTLGTSRTTKEAEARELFREVAFRYPLSSWAPRALMMRGELEQRQQLYQRDDVLGASVPSALITYRQVAADYQMTSAAETALWKLGHLYVGAKRYQLAAAAFALLAEQHPGTQFDAWYAAADVYDKRLHDAPAARAAYMRVPASSPHFREAQKRLR